MLYGALPQFLGRQNPCADVYHAVTTHKGPLINALVQPLAIDSVEICYIACLFFRENQHITIITCMKPANSADYNILDHIGEVMEKNNQFK